MATSAPVTKYRNEMIALFEERSKFLAHACVRESMRSGDGKYAVFLHGGANGETAVTRGLNGLIPTRNNHSFQTTVTLTEWHDVPEMTGFNIFISQGPQAQSMQDSSVTVLNQKIDEIILTELLTGTLTWNGGVAQTATIGNILKAKAILGNNDVPTEEEDNMFAVVSPAFLAYLQQTPEFSSFDYVDVKTHVGGVKRFRRWQGINWIEHRNLAGLGGATERCFMWHRNAIGLAMNSEEIMVKLGYDEKQDISWARASTYIGCEILQNTGIVEMTHDGSGIGTG